MAKKDKDSYEDLASVLGAEVLERADAVKEWIDTGNLALNYLCSGKFVGGGIPSGKVIEIFGPSSSCKTLFATNVLKGCQKKGGFSLFLDAENTLSKDFARQASHLETSKVLVLKADTLERGFAKIMAAIRKIRERFGNDKPIVIVYDSIAASPSDREFAETEMTEEQMMKAKDMPGERAKTISKAMRQLTPLMETTNTTVLFINQIRQKIGVMFGSPETTTGGNALGFYTSLRLKTKAEKRFTDKLGNVIGMGVTVRNVKNKCFRPFVDAKNMQLFFDKGINPLGGLLELLIQNERISPDGKGGTYKVNEPFACGQEIKFKSSLERNDIPVEPLLKCPALVDATTPEQVQEYIDIFGSAMVAVDQDIAKAETVTDSEEE